MTKKMLLSVSRCLKLLVTMASIGVLVLVAPLSGVLQAEATTVGQTYTGVVSSVRDGDTIRLQQPIIGNIAEIRLLGIDAPETFTANGHLPGNQIVPHGNASRDFLRNLLPIGTTITVVTDRVELDGLGRVLGYVYRGTLNVNMELLRQGHAVTHVIWPNTYSRFSNFRTALLEARTAGRGMWNPTNPIQELPFEYRLRVFNRQFERHVGDFLTKTFVSPADFRRVPVENRVQFGTQQDALNAGYRSATPAVTIYSVDLIGERVVLRNVGTITADISNWTLVSEVGNQRFRFPLGTMIQAGGSLTIVSGSRATGGTGILVWTRAYIWNNSGDPAVLINANNVVVSRR